MKNTAFTLILIFFCTTIIAQWEQVGQDIYGENKQDATGSSVSLNADGNRVAIYDTFLSGDSKGAVRVFELQNDVWVQLGNQVVGLLGDGQSAGNVVFNHIGSRFAFSSPLYEFNSLEYLGAVRVFELQGNSWVQVGDTLYGEQQGDFFGTSIDFNAEGNRLIVGAHQSGNLNGNKNGYIKTFELQNNIWELLGQQLNGNNDDEAGRSVSINDNGNWIAFSAPLNDQNGDNSGTVKIYELQANNWAQLGNSIYGESPGDNIGFANEPGSNGISLNGLGDKIVIGAPDRVTVYEIIGSTWTQLGNTIQGNSSGYFGGAVAINSIGNIVLIGDFSHSEVRGRAFTYKLEGSDWNQTGQTIIGINPADFLGYCVDINDNGNHIAIGTPFSDEGGNNTGKVEVFYDDAILSVDDIAFNQSVVLYPNPNRNSFSIYFQHNPQNVTISIVDVAGKRVYSEKITAQENITIDHNLDAGIYFVKLTSNTSEATLKMVVE